MKPLTALKSRLSGSARRSETELLLLGRLLANQSRSRGEIASLHDAEFKVFSQFGDDGIIQWLVQRLQIGHKTFIEFGVEDYRESNTRFLMMNDNWSGLVIDGSRDNVDSILGSEYYWRHDLQAECAFIDCDNINGLISASGLGGEIGLLHIDLDGNDYWVWKAIDAVSPIVLVLEYNSVFGPERAITVPYDKGFVRTQAHFSNLYFGASLPALHDLSTHKGYGFVGCNSAGNNAYFVRRDKLSPQVPQVSLQQGYVSSKLRESRDRSGRLSHVAGGGRAEVIRGLPVYNTRSNTAEAF
jgi:hypothetical protein